MNGGPCEAVVFDLGGVVFNWLEPARFDPLAVATPGQDA